jgi:L-alanine-DL-glutamate epimerase-like enolase superfamily enzyme
VALSREVVGDDVEIFVDANGGYDVKQAQRLGRVFEGEYGVTWFEEPVSSDDLAGLRQVRTSLDLDVAAGEYGYDETYFDHLVGADAVDCIQADVTRCGGYTSWLRIAAIAGAHGLEVSGHCAPNLHAPVAIGIPNLRHVEYFHDHSRLEAMIFENGLVPRNGNLWMDGDRLGHGMSIRDSDAESFRVG